MFINFILCLQSYLAKSSRKHSNSDNDCFGRFDNLRQLLNMWSHKNKASQLSKSGNFLVKTILVN